MLLRLWHYFLRELANHCIAPGLRMQLFRWSGIRIGKDAFVNMRLHVEDSYRGGAVTIGERVAIASGVTLIADSHPNQSKLAAIPAFHVRGKIEIGDDAWLGANVIVMANVHIGQCAVIGSGAVVTKDVDPYAIMVGIPARKLGDVRDKLGWPGAVP
ncbi:MAG TPA: acyltransferase [Terriglobales bacterium]|nr:acyltransferase [Terriglobales bacterium]